MGWIRRIAATLRRANATDAFDEEAAFHIEQRIEEHTRAGMALDEARREARRQFGSVTRARERSHDANTLPWLADALQDLRYAGRQLRRNPGFAATAILTLAIGIGANTVLFGLVNELLLKPLPVPSPHELVLFNWLEGRKGMRTGMDGIRTTDPATGRSTSTAFSYPTFRRLQEANRTLTELFAFYPLQQLNVVVDGQADVASGQFVSGNYFRGLGVDAALGRTLTDADDRPGAAPVATITHQHWRRRFDSDPDIVGKAVLVNKVPFAIVGVTPEGFTGTLDVTQSPDFTLPFAAEPLLTERSDLTRPAFLWVNLMGRLRPHASRGQAAADLMPVMQSAMLDEWRQAVAAANRPAGGDTTRTVDDASTLRAEAGAQGLMDSRRRYAQPLNLLMGGAVLVLIIACVNIASLLLARGAARQREIATRLAIGAGRGRLLRQLCTESVLLAALGAGVGLALARWAAGLIAVWRPWGGSAVLDGGLDWRIFGFCAGLALCSGVIVGLLPAVRAVRTDLVRSARGTTGTASPRLSRALVAAQVALSFVLIAAAVLFAGTLRNLHAVDKGFNADNLLLFRVQPQLNGYEQPQIAALYSGMLTRIAALPGVRAATLSRHSLLGLSRRADSVVVEGAAQGQDTSAEVNIVAPSFFATMEIPLLLGRGFDDRDGAGAPPVAVVNERFAAAYLSGANPVGHRLWFGSEASGTPLEIVGMTRDAKYTDLRSATNPTVYVPVQQDVPGQASMAVRTAGDAAALVPAIRTALRGLDPLLPIFDVRSQAEQIEQSLARETMFARFSTIFGLIAVALAAIGLYGTVAYAVAQRTSEIGLRMALGAGRATVADMIVRQSLRLAGVGIAIGVPLALGAVRLAGATLDRMLFGLEGYDPGVLAGTAGFLALVAVAASLVPARAAARVDPLIALRHE